MSTVKGVEYYVEKAVRKYLGDLDTSVTSALISYINAGYNKDKTTSKIASMIDSSKAARMTSRVYEVLEEKRLGPRYAPKRPAGGADESAAKKVKREDASASSKPTIVMPSGGHHEGPLSTQQIKDMMANAQKMIELRKKTLGTILASTPPAANPLIVPPMGEAFADKAKKIADLQAEIAAKLSAMPPRNKDPLDKPQPLILDDSGRTVDASGNQVQIASRMPTLKANIRAKRRAEFRQQLQERPSEDVSEAAFFDPRVSVRPAVRGKRTFQFHEPGMFQQVAARMRTQAQLEKLQNEISQIARKTGISSAMKLAMVAPRPAGWTPAADGGPPLIEWWDQVILQTEQYDAELEKGRERYQGITNLVEHPTQMAPPTDGDKSVTLPVFLTKRERKKLRRTNRREAWKDKQEKIRLGLEPPPEPKVRMSNLMRVLGNEAVQDPTKIEAHVRAQMAKRQKTHQDANAARKLTTEQRKAKKISKIKEDTSTEVHVAIYRVLDLSNPSKKFKLETNAKQLFMTGTVVLFRDVNVVVVEGGPKQQKKYKKLMLRRIKWEEDLVKNKDGEERPDLDNKCSLVWEGTTKGRSFGEMKFKLCPNESFAREHFRKQGVEHYWDLCYSGTVIEQEAT